MLKARQIFFFFFFSFFHSIGKAGVLGGVSVSGERKREKRRWERRRRFVGDVVRGGREFYDIILGKREGGRRVQLINVNR